MWIFGDCWYFDGGFTLNRDKVKVLFLLHMMLMIYSTSGICSKMAAKQSFLSLPFCFYYGMVILLLGFYAIGWQQVIKRIPLTMAFANKAVTVVWGIIWGVLVFHESLTPAKIVGAVIVVTGVVLFAISDGEEANG